jgi:hypothetical protein
LDNSNKHIDDVDGPSTFVDQNYFNQWLQGCRRRLIENLTFRVYVFWLWTIVERSSRYS